MHADGLTPLQLDVVQFFCALRVGVDAAMTSSGITALMAASQRDHARIVAALVEGGASLELTSHDGRTALAIAGVCALSPGKGGCGTEFWYAGQVVCLWISSFCVKRSGGWKGG